MHASARVRSTHHDGRFGTMSSININSMRILLLEATVVREKTKDKVAAFARALGDSSRQVVLYTRSDVFGRMIPS